MDSIDIFISPVRDSKTMQTALICVLIMMALDIIFGVLNACIKHDFSSKKMREGIGHKAGNLGIIIVADIVDGCIIGGIDLGFSSPVMMSSCVYIIFMEFGSILETLAQLNPALTKSPLFSILRKSAEITEQLKEGEHFA